MRILVFCFCFLISSLVSNLVSSQVFASENRLHRLILRGDVQEAEKYLDYLYRLEKDPSYFSFSGKNLKRLLSETNLGGQTPLDLAFAGGYFQLAKRFLKEFKQEDAKIKLQGAFYQAYLTDNIFLACRLVSSNLMKEFGDINFVNYQGMTPLLLALKKRDKTLINAVLEAGANPNQLAAEGSSPLIFAVMQGSGVALLDDLVRHGAEVNFIDSSGYSALHYSFERLKGDSDYSKVAEYLVEKGAEVASLGRQSLNWAVESGNSGLTKALIQSGFDVNFLSPNGFSPLILASIQGDLDLVKVLLSRGASLRESHPNGTRPLAFAAQNGHFEVVRELVEWGAEVDHVNRMGESALFYAFHGLGPDERSRNDPYRSGIRFDPLGDEGFLKRMAVSEYLLDHSASVSPNLKEGLIPAIRAGQVSLVKKLLKRDRLQSARTGQAPLIDLEYLDKNGVSPLIAAATSSQFELIQILLDHGARLEPAIEKIRQMHSKAALYALYYYPKIMALELSSAPPLKGSLREIEDPLEFSDRFRFLKYNLNADLKEAIEQGKKDHRFHRAIEILGELKKLFYEKNKKLYFTLKSTEIREECRREMSQGKAAQLAPFSNNEKQCVACFEPIENLEEGGLEGPGPAGCYCLFCEDCTNTFTGILLRSGGGAKNVGRCPLCKGLMSLEYLKNLNRPSDQIERLLERQIHSFSQMDSNSIPCPTPGCWGGASLGEDQTHHYSCLLCDTSCCLRCGQDHPGKCGEADLRQKIEFEAFLKASLDPDAELRDCPECGKIVLRGEGCNSIDCPDPKCGYNFHWVYGDHDAHPFFLSQATAQGRVHDNEKGIKQYRTRGRLHY